MKDRAADADSGDSHDRVVALEAENRMLRDQLEQEREQRVRLLEAIIQVAEGRKEEPR